MTLSMMAALAGFAFVMSISPGPGNFLLLASGLNFGFRRSVPLILGISIGFLTMVFVVGLGIGELLEDNPSFATALKFICAGYILWLASKIARAGDLTAADDTTAKPISFPQAAILQLVNPKAWAVALVVTVSYTEPSNYFSSLILLIAIFAVVNLPALSVWAAGGVVLRQLITDPRKVRIFNVTMAILLIGSILFVLLESAT